MFALERFPHGRVVGSSTVCIRALSVIEMSVFESCMYYRDVRIRGVRIKELFVLERCSY